MTSNKELSYDDGDFCISIPCTNYDFDRCCFNSHKMGLSFDDFPLHYEVITGDMDAKGWLIDPIILCPECRKGVPKEMLEKIRVILEGFE